MKRLWRRAIGPFTEFGITAGALYVLDRGLRALSPHMGLYVYELIEQPIDGRPLLPGGLAKNLEFIEIGQEPDRDAYLGKNTPVATRQLTRAGVRLAAPTNLRLVP